MTLEAGHDVCADATELVHAGQATDDGPVVDLHMAGQRGVVGKDGVAADLHVMGEVHVGHDPVVVAHPGHACILHRAPVEGAKLADGVAVPDFQARRLAAVLHVLTP